VVSERKRSLRRARRGVGFFLTAAWLAFSCQSQTDEPTGGETHFLTRCEAGSNSCGPELSCSCGVCTLPCSRRAECARFPVAECVAVKETACGASQLAGYCDVSCASDGDCALLSLSHRCEAGVCRAGSLPSTGGSGGAGGSAASGTGGGDGGTSGCVQGQVSANEVLVVGDSFLALGHQITAYLEDMERSAGALSAGERYRDNSSLTANALALGGNGIADQYRAGLAEAGVELVIMNGGGADILGSPCDPTDASCPTLMNAAAALAQLFSEMAEDGVQHVIYAFYPDPVDGGVRGRVDAFRPLAESACANSPVPCAWLDLRPVFAGHYGEYIQPDGLNPTAAGSQASAAAIAALMREQCIAQ
jgi:lysophospholipase L1-like esterase